MNLLVSIILSIAITILLNLIIEVTIYSNIRKRSNSSLVLLLASLGLYGLLQNVLSLAFGDDVKSLLDFTPRNFIILNAQITVVQIYLIITTICITVCWQLIEMKTRFGTLYKAVESNEQLAYACGIRTTNLRLISCSIGTAIASIASIMIAMDMNMFPTMGLNLLMLGIVAMIIGYKKTGFGILFGAFVLSLLQSTVIWTLGSGWRDSVGFLVLVIWVIISSTKRLRTN
jgi:branched-subunit amino acid ABC-type transport system permease component